MRTYWLIALIVIAGCAPVKPTATEQYRVPQSILTVRPIATLTQVHLTPVAKPTESPVLPVVTADPQWMALAKAVREKARRALSGAFWEDTEFKEDGYAIGKQMIMTSTGKIRKDSMEILKRFRWGMEFMDAEQLHEAIKILDRYN